MRVSKIYRSDELRLIHHGHHAGYQVVYVAERSRLGSVSIDGNRLARERLYDEVADHAAVLGVHARAIRIKNTDNANVDSVRAVVVHAERFRNAFALIVAASRSDRVYVAPVGFLLRMFVRVAVYFRRGCLENSGAAPLRKSEHVDHPDRRRFDRFYGVVLVVDRRCGTCKVVYLIRIDTLERMDDVVFDSSEIRVIQMAFDVLFLSGKIVVDADDAVAAFEQPVDQVAPDESRPAGNDDFHIKQSYQKTSSIRYPVFHGAAQSCTLKASKVNLVLHFFDNLCEHVRLLFRKLRHDLAVECNVLFSDCVDECGVRHAERADCRIDMHLPLRTERRFLLSAVSIRVLSRFQYRFFCKFKYFASPASVAFCALNPFLMALSLWDASWRTWHRN